LFLLYIQNRGGQPMARCMISSAALHTCDRNKEYSKSLWYFYQFFVSYKSLMSCLLACWSKLLMIFWKMKTSYLRKERFFCHYKPSIRSGIFCWFY